MPSSHPWRPRRASSSPRRPIRPGSSSPALTLIPAGGWAAQGPAWAACTALPAPRILGRGDRLHHLHGDSRRFRQPQPDRPPARPDRNLSNRIFRLRRILSCLRHFCRNPRAGRPKPEEDACRKNRTQPISAAFWPSIGPAEACRGSSTPRPASSSATWSGSTSAIGTSWGTPAGSPPKAGDFFL